MKASTSRFLCTLTGLMAAIGAQQPALADDSEVFLSTAFTSGAAARPNVLFIVDTSTSMNGIVDTYDPTKTYSGPCSTDYVYYATYGTRGATPPSCSNNSYRFTVANNRCRASYTTMQAQGQWIGRAQQVTSGGGWGNLGSTSRKVECADDHGIHGDRLASDGPSNESKYARSSGGWTNSPSLSWNNKQQYAFYSANYMNWYHGTEEGSAETRLEIVQKVAKQLITDLEGVNLGLMRYSVNTKRSTEPDDYLARGGMVTYPISELTPAAKEAMIDQISSWRPNGYTPLSETYYEAYQYLSGGSVVFGNNSTDGDNPMPSVAASRVGNTLTSNTYDSPMDYNCQRTFVVYLTDGLPTQDEEATAAIQALPNFATDGYVAVEDGGNGSQCPAKGPSGNEQGGEDADGRCMINLAAYMYNHDMHAMPGKQNVITYVVGFGDDIVASADYLENIAKAGGGEAYTQTDAAGLTAALKKIFSDVVEGANSTFVAPTVAVNAFNRTRTLNSLYVSVFAPTNSVHWPGNLKRYKLKDGEIYGAEDQKAVNPATGFFFEGISDEFGGNTDDGPDVTKGGAASKLPAWDARKIYTNIDPGSDLNSTSNRFAINNNAITAATLGLPADDPARDDVIKFTLGYDAETSGNRLAMGDPMHARPAVAIYGGSEETPSGLVFITTNDGMLHAVDMNTGVEEWAFIPEEMLGRLGDLYDDEVIANRQYGIDGDVRVFKYDANGDGMVDGEDRIYAVFGFGRGGSVYYALDVTERDDPKVKWKKTALDLPALGEAWSPPVLTRVNIQGQSDPQKLVVIFGAGYDPGQENYTYTQDDSGNGIYMLELESGNLLWSAGKTGSSASWRHPDMVNAIPSEIAVVDLNSDGFGDRLYFGDMGGRIWRLDFWHGQNAGNFASGGVLAELGAAHLDDPSDQDARRFYYAPDVALVTPRGSAPFLNLAIGSGYRGHPLDTTIRDRFYSIRDYQPFTRRTNTSFSSANWTRITDDQVIDVTDDVDTVVPDGAPGWKLELREGSNTWRGEKVLAEAVTVNGVIFFPTFTPVGSNPLNPCLAATLNRTWAVYVESARPYGLRDVEVPGDGDGDGDGDDEGGDGNVGDPSDRYEVDNQGGIAPGTAVIQSDGKTLCLKGVATHKCVDIGDVTRTFWERRQ